MVDTNWKTIGPYELHELYEPYELNKLNLGGSNVKHKFKRKGLPHLARLFAR